jgi:hypothetical protein
MGRGIWGLGAQMTRTTKHVASQIGKYHTFTVAAHVDAEDVTLLGKHA